VVAAPVAATLHAPLDVIVIRKVGHPWQPELALAAVSSGGDVVVNDYARGFPPDLLDARIRETTAKAQELAARLRPGCGPIDCAGQTAIVVDDGNATSATMACAVLYVRRCGASRVVCAAPVAPADQVEALAERCDRLELLVAAREREFAVGRYFMDFREVSDEEVRAALRAEDGAR
jgi:putative phosphoribosyl transferase